MRYIYNYFLDLKQKLYETEKKSMSFNKCSKELTILKQKKEWLKEVILPEDNRVDTDEIPDELKILVITI